MTKDDGRERGILTSADREFLRSDPDEYSRQARHARRDAIVERMRNAVLDFSILFEELDRDDFETIFSRPRANKMPYNDPTIEAGLRDTLALVLESGGGDGLFRGLGNSGPHTQDLEAERLLLDALERLAWFYGYQINTAELKVEAEKIPWRALEGELKEGGELDPEQLARFLSRDDVDTSAIQEQVRTMIFEQDDEEN